MICYIYKNVTRVYVTYCIPKVQLLLKRGFCNTYISLPTQTYFIGLFSDFTEYISQMSSLQ
jgi:hypothetical protein